MQSPSVGMKIYDNSWYLTHRLSPEQAADFLKDMGATWVIAQSRLLPMAEAAGSRRSRPHVSVIMILSNK